MKRITYLITSLFLCLFCNLEAHTYPFTHFNNVENNTINLPRITLASNTLNTKWILNETKVTECIIPKGISPNNDGLNDKFDLSCFNVTKLEIFNRNGTLLYSKENYVDEWIGQTNKGDSLPVGTYFYTMIYEGGTKKYSAWVYISR